MELGPRMCRVSFLKYDNYNVFYRYSAGDRKLVCGHGRRIGDSIGSVSTEFYNSSSPITNNLLFDTDSIKGISNNFTEEKKYNLVVGVTSGVLGPSSSICLPNMSTTAGDAVKALRKAKRISIKSKKSGFDDQASTLDMIKEYNKTTITEFMEKKLRFVDFLPRSFCDSQIQMLDTTSNGSLLDYNFNCQENKFSGIFKVEPLQQPSRRQDNGIKNKMQRVSFKLENVQENCTVYYKPDLLNSEFVYIQVLSGLIRCGIGNPISGPSISESIHFPSILSQALSTNLKIYTENISIQAGFSICHSSICDPSVPDNTSASSILLSSSQNSQGNQTLIASRKLDDELDQFMVSEVDSDYLDKFFCEDSVYKAVPIDQGSSSMDPINPNYLNPCYGKKFTLIFDAALSQNSSNGIATFSLSDKDGFAPDFELFSVLFPKTNETSESTGNDSSNPKNSTNSSGQSCQIFIQLNDKYLFAGVGGLYNSECDLKINSARRSSSIISRASQINVSTSNLLLSNSKFVCSSENCITNSQSNTNTDGSGNGNTDPSNNSSEIASDSNIPSLVSVSQANRASNLAFNSISIMSQSDNSASINNSLQSQNSGLTPSTKNSEQVLVSPTQTFAKKPDSRNTANSNRELSLLQSVDINTVPTSMPIQIESSIKPSSMSTKAELPPKNSAKRKSATNINAQIATEFIESSSPSKKNKPSSLLDSPQSKDDPTFTTESINSTDQDQISQITIGVPININVTPISVPKISIEFSILSNSSQSSTDIKTGILDAISEFNDQSEEQNEESSSTQTSNIKSENSSESSPMTSVNSEIGVSVPVKNLNFSELKKAINMALISKTQSESIPQTKTKNSRISPSSFVTLTISNYMIF
ncbi:hypothetical protein AYI69_g4237 [Smittium culicis]|uniref:Uncharacterized protein n=1 Tax=Smittium culicis TaxID=133412 RepID=A0A1R1YF87_9FUNG|nr:hypothetical protein AYI69_g4237 [Smittium culicis]